MRGTPVARQLFYAIDIESRIPVHHPLRVVKRLPDGILAAMRPDFEVKRRGTATHHSLTDPEARLMHKASCQAAKLAHGATS